jgi:hypothetical protein
VAATYAADGDSFAEKVDVAVTGSGVDARSDDDYVAVVGVVDRSLNIVEVRRSVAVYRYNSCPRWHHKRQAHKNEDQSSHLKYPPYKPVTP